MTRKKTIAALFLGIICVLGSGVRSSAQIYSQNIVGYYNLLLFPGDNLIANQLDRGDNSLNTLFVQGIPNGTVFTKWNPAVNEYLPSSVYNGGSGWSINYTLGFGEGGLLHPPSLFTNTFFGNVWSGYDGVGPFVPPVVTGNGSFLLSCYIPINNASFHDVVGRAPEDGESVTMFNALSQISTTTTFQAGTWDNGDPSLNIGQAAFFNLGFTPAAVPEPASGVLLGMGIVSLAVFSRCRQ